MLNPNVTGQLHQALVAAENVGAEEPVALDVAEMFGFADAFLIVSGAVERNVQAIAGAVEDALNDRGIKTLRREGRELGRWVLLDFGDLIVHVFHREERDFYSLERLWADCPAVDLEALRSVA